MLANKRFSIEFIKKSYKTLQRFMSLEIKPKVQ